MHFTFNLLSTALCATPGACLAAWSAWRHHRSRGRRRLERNTTRWYHDVRADALQSGSSRNPYQEAAVNLVTDDRTRFEAHGITLVAASRRASAMSERYALLADATGVTRPLFGYTVTELDDDTSHLAFTVRFQKDGHSFMLGENERVRLISPRRHSRRNRQAAAPVAFERSAALHL